MTRLALCLLLSCLAITLPRLARAGDTAPCSDAVLESLGNYVGKAHFQVQSDTCKVWPADSGITLAVVAYTVQPVRDGEEVEAWDAIVAMVDTQSAKIIAATKDIHGEADAITRFSGYALDTAPYQLAPGVRAFGVVDNNVATRGKCADGGWDTVLSLWVRDGDRLRPLFDTNLNEWKDVEGSGCNTGEPGKNEYAHMTVAIEKSRSHGFSDISLTAHVTSTTWKTGGGKTDESKRTQRVVLHYDGKSYADMPYFWWSSAK